MYLDAAAAAAAVALTCIGSSLLCRGIVSDVCGPRGRAIAAIVGAFGPPGLMLVSLWRVKHGPPDDGPDDPGQRHADEWA